MQGVTQASMVVYVVFTLFQLSVVVKLENCFRRRRFLMWARDPESMALRSPVGGGRRSQEGREWTERSTVGEERDMNV